MRNALALALLMVMALVTPITTGTLEDGPAPPLSSWSATETTFSDGSVDHSNSLCSGCGGSASFDEVPGAGLASGAVNLSLEPVKVSGQSVYGFAAGTLTGSPTNMSIGSTGLALTTTLGGPPQAGNVSQQVSTAVQWSGLKTFDTLHLVCSGTVCGAVTGSNLTIVAREIILETGTSISVSGASSIGSGAGASTSTPSNGRSDGAGGGGHGGAGGAGGGTSGGSGGSTYGNGTELGSPGGDVSGNSNIGDAYGGHGGGHLILKADSLVVNGSLLADGAEGDPGASPNGGTGAGGSGGGGGSGGSIDLQVNTLDVGSSGVISANGGSGGDGEDGQQSGIGIGMYDGGDGGGGGGGGFVSILTTSGGSTSLGTISASLGGGGLKGLKHGTGNDGVDGSPGSAGTVSTGTWSGYATGSYAATNGVFIADAITFPSARGPLWMNHTASVPSNSTLEVFVRTSMSPVGTATPDWAPWDVVSAQNATLGRATFVQLSYAMTRNATASPVVSDVTFDWSRWTVLDGLALSVDAQTLPSPSDVSLATTSSLLDVANAEIVFSLPDDATPTGDAHLWIGWSLTDATLTLEHSTVGVVMDVDTDVHPGHDVVLSQTEIASMLSTASTRTASDGRVWRDVTLDLTSSGGTGLTDFALSVDHTVIPWSMHAHLDLAAPTNASIIQTCGSVYLSTTCAALSAHDVTYNTGINTDDGVLITFSDLSLSWIDDEAPRLERISHRYEGVDQPTVRFGDRTVVVVEDLIDEDTATVDLWFAPNVGAVGDSNHLTTSWNAAFGGWVAPFDTADHLAGPGAINVSVRMTDQRGNTATHPSEYGFMVLPSMPEVATLSIEADQNTTLLEGPSLAGVWEGDGPQFSFQVTDAGNRSDLLALVDLTHNGVTTERAAAWNVSVGAYLATWAPGRESLGAWTVEIRLSETTGPGESDEDGLVIGPDATMELVDRTAPGNLSLTVPTTHVLGESLFLSSSWSLSPEEHAIASLSVFGPNGDEIDVKGTLAGTSTTLNHTVPASKLVEGLHRIRLEVRDEGGNTATPVEANVSIEERIGVDGTLQTNRANSTTVEVIWDFRTDESTAQLTVHLDGTQVHANPVPEGGGSVALDLLTAANDLLATGAQQATLSVELCHYTVDECLSNTSVLDLTDLQDLGLEGTCLTDALDGNATDLMVCQISNNGLRPVVLTWATAADGIEDGWTLTLLPGVQRTLWEANPAFTQYNEIHRSTQEWAVSWSLSAAHEGGPSTILQSGEFTFIPPQGPDEGEDNQTSQDDGAGSSAGEAVWVVLTVLVFVVPAVVSLLLVLRMARKQAEGSNEEKAFEPSFAEVSTPDVSTPVMTEDPEAITYHAELLEQGYSEEDATAYTQQYFPTFRA